MEFLPGGDLGEHLELYQAFSEQNSKLCIAEIILALEELHNQDIIFRNLKPKNILLDCEELVKLINFGLSKDNIKLQDKGTKSFCGSVACVAPEMLQKIGHEKAIDYYAVGILLYEILFGIPPFYDECQQKMFLNIKHQEILFPQEISQHAENLLNILLKKNLSQRLGFQNGFQDIKQHQWFKEINWKDVLSKKVQMDFPITKNFGLFQLKQDFNFHVNKKINQKYHNQSFSKN